MLIDFHTHCFPDNIAEKAIGKLSKIGGIKPLTDGTLESNRKYLKDCSVDRAVICSIATNPHQTVNVNNFAVSINSADDYYYALGSVHPESDAVFISNEMKRLKNSGIRGIKLHPDYMGHYIDEDCYENIFRGAVENELFVLIHAGWDFYSPDSIHASPERIARVLDRFPDVKLIAAHMGGYRCCDENERCLVGRNLWLDLSLLAQDWCGREQAKRIICSHSPERLLFGSDTPWCSPLSVHEYLKSLELPQSLMNKIDSENALKLLGHT